MSSYSDIGLTRNTVRTSTPVWLQDFPPKTYTGTLDATTALAAFPTGLVKGGTVLGKMTVGAVNRFGPYGGTSEEVQTVTEGGSGLTSFTLTFSGQTTGSIAAAATAATVQAALEALSNIAPGDVAVTGNAGGPYTVTFGGAYVDTDVAALTATPTGGTGTVTIATTTAGGADVATDGRQVAVGFLLEDVLVRAGANVPIAVVYRGLVYEDRLPAGSLFDANARTDLASKFTFVRLGA